PLVSIRGRARRLLGRLDPRVRKRLAAAVADDRSQVGGGALPTVELPTAVLAVGAMAADARELDEALRRAVPPVIRPIAHPRLPPRRRAIWPAGVPTVAAGLTAASGVA